MRRGADVNGLHGSAEAGSPKSTRSFWAMCPKDPRPVAEGWQLFGARAARNESDEGERSAAKPLRRSPARGGEELAAEGGQVRRQSRRRGRKGRNPREMKARHRVEMGVWGESFPPQSRRFGRQT